MTPKIPSMKRCLVTGAAGFIGSRLAARLLDEGHAVTGIDSFTDFYERAQKEGNVAPLQGRPGFTMVEADLLDHPLEGLLEGIDWVFHQAAQAGVRASWGKSFRVYADNNILATQRLLEACLAARPGKFVNASSSSIYGDQEKLPVAEDALPAPYSPYGVTKLAAEHLCRLYWRNFGLSTVSLRYFTVYGPGQRPDMAFHRFLRAMVLGEPITVYGDGEQTRDFTYVDDAVEANLLAAAGGRDGEAYNIGGGHRCMLREVIALMEKVSGRRAELRHLPPQKGDVRDTHSDTSKAAAELGFAPRHGLEEGIGAEFQWLRDRLSRKKGR